MDEIIVVEIEWFEARGPFKKVGQPRLFAWLRGVFAGSWIADGHAAVVAWDYSSSRWMETSGAVRLADAGQLVTALAVVGLPERAPRVEGVNDTSDGWAALQARVGVGEDERAFKIAAQSSGFEGPDAEQLQAIFRAVFHLAGYVDFDPVLYGHDEAPP